jgi:TRAP-type mannitol/chloroaromatic compound transport system substrate-binding protein
MTKLTRRTALGALAGTLAAPAVARAQSIRWRMATSWPRNLPGPGVSALRLAERIRKLSGGRLEIDVFPAGTIVPAFEVLDAVGGGTVEIGHTASFYWRGKMPASVFFTTVPFGLGPVDHTAWLEFGEGQALWDELYRPHGVRAFAAGNTGPCMGGWFRKEIKSAADIKGLRIRVLGIGGDVFSRLGATPVTIPPADIITSMQTGAIDAVEFLAPSSDLITGVHKVAPFYYAPGFNKPNGTGEALVSLKAWETLSADLRAIVMEACRLEHATALADAAWQNAQALATLVAAHGTRVVFFPDSLIDVARPVARALIAEIGGGSPVAGRIVASYNAALERSRAWSALSASMAALLARR